MIIMSIPEHPGYFAKDDGTIWSRWRGNRWSKGQGKMTMRLHQVRGRTFKDGRKVIHFSKGSRPFVYAHELILSAFDRPRPEGGELRREE